MLTPLKDYQRDAVKDILKKLGRARDDWHQHDERTSFALSAPTSSGKTVMAAAAIEAVLHGSDEFDIDADPTAVFLWVSKEPALNEQTAARFRQHSDRIPWSDLVMLDKDFAEASLQTGTVYFINPQKLAVTGGFVKYSDSRNVTFWDILRNTIADPDKTLYLVLDEAHEGMKKTSAGDQSIVLKIINGNGTNPPAPIVFGISATLDRFTQAMSKATDRTSRPNVTVDPKHVQASGLIKSAIHLDIPDELGEFTTTLVREATKDFLDVCARWDQYSSDQGIDPVNPLMVVQIPNKESGSSGTDKGKAEEEALIHLALETIREHWPEMPDDGLAHVMGSDHGAITVGSYTIPRVEPQLVQQQERIRILFAKDAISTGWDCPRAEVLLSLRPGKDPTYVTQLIGRMVRTPLARTTSVDRLNTASVYLPKFDAATTKMVIGRLLGTAKDSEGESTSLVEKVLLKPITLKRNTEIAPDIADLIETLPSYARPTAVARPIKRLLKAAQAFAQDKLVPEANKEAHETLFAVLDAYVADYGTDLDKGALQIRTADIRRIRVDLGKKTTEEDESQLEADANTVDDALRYLRRILTASVVNGYLRREVQSAVDKAEEDGGSMLDVDLMQVRSRVAALGLLEVPDGKKKLQAAVEDAAETLTRHWLNVHAGAIKKLSDARKPVYEGLRGMARTPELTPIEIKSEEQVDSVGEDSAALPTVERHVLANEKGLFPLEAKLNRWERSVIEHELHDGDVLGWYRNPSTASRHSLRVTYEAGDGWKSVQPDLIFVREHDGVLVPSIIDPHGAHLSDASPKLRALAEYASRHGDQFGQITAIGVEKDGYLIGLNLLDASVQRAVFESPADKDSILALFEKHGKKAAPVKP